MSDLFGNHIFGFPTRRLISLYLWESVHTVVIDSLDVRLRTLSNLSAHFSKIAYLSVRRVIPSALRNVVAAELFGPLIVFSAS